MEEIRAQLSRYIQEKQYFPARWLDSLSKTSGLPADLLAQGLGASFVLVTLVHPQAHFVANFLCVLTICLLTYIYRAERPNRDNLLVLWLCFSVLTLLDPLLEVVPFYYVLKISALMLLFLRPVRAVSKIKAWLLKLRIVQTEGPKEDDLVSADVFSDAISQRRADSARRPVERT